MLIHDIPFINKVKVGAYWHPVRDVPAVCSKSVRRLVTKAVGSDDYWGMCGSVTLVKRAGKSFGVFTRHQINNTELSELPETFTENYLVPSLQPTFKNLSVTGLKFPTLDTEEEFFDIIAFIFNPKDRDVRNEQPYFTKGLLGQKVIKGSWFYVGFPNQPNSLIYDVNGERVIDFKQNVLVKDCQLDMTYTGPDYVKRFTHKLNNYEPDGLSGGAIFCLTETEKGFEIGLDCIITRGNKSYLYGVNSDFLDMLLR